MRKLLVIVLVLVAAPAAHTFWTSPTTAGSHGEAVARSLPQGEQPTASAVGPTVTVQWTPSTFAGATLAYELRRYPGGVVVPCTPADAGNGKLECVEASVAPGVHQWTITPTLNNWRGAESPASAAITVYNDLVPPVTTASLSPAANGAGWNNSSPVAVTLTATDNAGGSGVQAIRYTTDGSDPRTSPTAVTYTSPVSVAATNTLRFSAIDNANIEEAPQSQAVQIDTVAPSNSLSLVPVTGGSHMSGSTVWYRGAAAGSLRIRNAVTDADSGPASSSTSALAGAAAGWTHAAGSVSTPAGGPYDSNLFSWAAGTTTSPTTTVTGADAAGNTTAEPALAFTLDNTAPTSSASVSPAANGAGWNNTAVDVTLTSSDNAGGSGLASIRYTTDGSDPRTSPTATVYSGTFSVGATATVRFSGLDNVGNAEVPKQQALQIDTVAPANSISLQNVSGGVYLSGSILFYRGAAAGSFRIRNTITDAGGSGADTSTTSLGGTTTGWTHTGSTTTNPFVSNPFSWVAGTTSSPVATITAADVAGNTTPLALTLTNDSTPPAGGASFPSLATYGSGAAWNAGCGTAATGDICGTPDETGGSGVASVQLVIQRSSDGRCLNPANGNWTNGSCNGVAPSTFNPAATPVWSANMACAVNTYTVAVTQTDNVGNTTTTAPQGWLITSCA